MLKENHNFSTDYPDINSWDFLQPENMRWGRKMDYFRHLWQLYLVRKSTFISTSQMAAVFIMQYLIYNFVLWMFERDGK